ncbi:MULTISPECIES: sulfurtransferase [Mameliella]|uniref:sulfurtransferase n=1 Tax=Mameliella TaxID=1434019 RepID=UPI0008411D1E|nr:MULTISPECIES: sulfurtransferase [Mameliella]MCR9272345.1 sulfurtransferase [Paracoccaceae bacterium]ODM46387.1 thiosulfate sulfurtransferase [Ruegeria sp. PBVC088]MBY6117654.1 sulfurtransferase [Mameliella alba]MDD9732570.1 sulfurtransferase [Mameliella sp. AT18]OWV44552.1 sulfurtransferase [Mameliella alba]
MESALISPAELQTLMTGGNIVLIDTRDPESFAAGHIEGAVNMHDIFTYLATSDAEGMATLRDKFAAEFGAAGLDGTKTAVIYEASMNTGFGQSCRGFFLLSYLGYPRIKVLHGGYAAWDAAGLPVSTETVAPTPGGFEIDESAAEIMMDLDDMKAALAEEDAVILDVRDIDEWIGTSSSPYGVDFCPRKGRIPGAVWIEWYRMMKPGADGPMMKSRDEVLAECATVGITPDTPVKLYCFKGARASNTFLALKEAGVKDVALYFGSWNEWSRDPALPIEEGLPFPA